MPKGVRNPVNHFVICLDRSGSMQGIAQQAVNAFNQNVKSIREGAIKSGQKSTVTLVTFGEDVREEYFCEDVEKLVPYDLLQYRPNGGTPLFDAVGLTVSKLLKRDDANYKHVSFMCIVITDGEENTSRAFPMGDPGRLTDLLSKAQKTDRWSFAFLLPPNSKDNFCRRFGIPDGNVAEWEATTRGAAVAAAAVDRGIGSYFGSRAQGKSSTRGFFTTDLSKVSKVDVQSKLDDVRDKVTILPVPKEAVIKDFVEDATGQNYERGIAFYQLTKDEQVQPTKGVMLMKKGERAVYGGDQARGILGLPDSLTVKVRPGNHADWDIFVQSASLNRKLVRGTKLIVLKRGLMQP